MSYTPLDRQLFNKACYFLDYSNNIMNFSTVCMPLHDQHLYCVFLNTEQWIHCSLDHSEITSHYKINSKWDENTVITVTGKCCICPRKIKAIKHVHKKSASKHHWQCHHVKTNLDFCTTRWRSNLHITVLLTARQHLSIVRQLLLCINHTARAQYKC